MLVCFREHGQLAKDAGYAGGISYVDVLEPSLDGVAKETEKLADATYIIAHFSYEGENNDLSRHLSAWNGNEPSAGRCRFMLIISEGGISALATAKHKKLIHPKDGTDVIYVLFARNQERILCSDNDNAIKVLQAFYLMTSDEAEAVCKGNLEDCPIALRPLFEQPAKASELLPALSILCQGYLAAHCGPDPDGGDGFILEVEEENLAGEIRLALLEMEWGEVLRRGIKEGWLGPSLFDPKGRLEMRKQVSSESYWNVFDSLETQDLREAFENEWKTISDRAFKETRTAELVGRLPDITAPKDFASVVAKAYVELKEILSGANNA